MSKSQGSSQLINKASIEADSIASLIALDTDVFTKVNVNAFYSGTPWGFSRLFEWDSTQAKTGHDGWSVINPDHLSTIGSANWYASDGDSTDDSGNGCWVRKGIGGLPYLTFLELGAKNDDASDCTTAVQSGINYLADNFGGGRLFAQEGVYRLNVTMKTGIIIEGVNKRTTYLKPHIDASVVELDTVNETHIGGELYNLNIGNADVGFTSSNGIDLIATEPTGNRRIDRFRIEKCFINGNAKRGINGLTGDFANNNFCQFLVVRDCSIKNNGAEGVRLEGKFIETSFDAVHVYGNAINSPSTVNNFFVTENTVGDFAQNLSITNFACNHFEATSNSYSDGAAIHVNNGRNLNISDGNIENGAILLEGAGLYNVSIRGISFGSNYLVDAYIKVKSVEGLIVEGNYFYGTRTSNIDIDGNNNNFGGIYIKENDYSTGTVTNYVSYSSDSERERLDGGIAYANTPFTNLLGEGNIADDLVNLYGWDLESNIDIFPDGYTITLKRVHDITVKHGTGNIYLSDGLDFLMDNADDRLVLQKYLDRWIEITRIKI